MKINKDTQICISLAQTAGNFGCAIHNAAFEYKNLNFIYKSLSVDDIAAAIDAIKTFSFRGAGITMPYKIAVLDYVDEISDEVKKIGSANTLVNEAGILKAYNTDAYSTRILLEEHSDKNKVLYILGKGGFSRAVAYASKDLYKDIKFITRKNWDEIKNIKDAIVFNCTPVENICDILDESIKFIDCVVTTKTGARMALLQASKQFYLYTNKEFPMNYITGNIKELLDEIKK